MTRNISDNIVIKIKQVNSQVFIDIFTKYNDKNTKNKVAVISSKRDYDPGSPIHLHEIIDFQLKGIKIIADNALA